MARICLTYRTTDSRTAAEDLRLALSEDFGPADLLVVDESTHPPLAEAAACQVLLAVIGPGWVHAGPAGGDAVQAAIAAALQTGRQVIPVLVENAGLPLPSQLPDAIANLWACREMKVRPDGYTHLDTRRLVKRLGEILVAEDPRQIDAQVERARLELAEWDRTHAGTDLAALTESEKRELFGLHARQGLPESVDFLMDKLVVPGDLATVKLVDHVLAMVNTRPAIDRLAHYLFHGERIQRNYAALFFKRRDETAILEEALQAGAIDWEQGFLQ